MKIGLIIPDINITGGTERVVINLYSQLEKLNYVVEIISVFSSYSTFDKKYKIRHLNMNKPNNFIKRFLKKEYIINQIDLENYDVVIGNNFYRYYAIPKRSETKQIEIQHMSYEESMLDFSLKKFFSIKLRNLIYKKLDHIVTLTNKDKNKFIENGLSNSICIENGLSFFPEEPASLENKNVIAIGRLTEQKGFDLLIEMWRAIIQKHPDWKLNIYGEGELQDVLQQQINKYKLNTSITIFPFTNEIQKKYLESSILLFTSRYEGFPMTLLESMSCGVPCVAFDCNSGPSDIIIDNIDGYVVPPFEKRLFIEKVNLLMESKKLRKKMGSKGRENIKRYDWHVLLVKWKELLELCVSGK